MRQAWTALALVLGLALPARGQQAEMVGQPIADVQVTSLDGAPVPVSVLELIETRIGEPLSMTDVRDTIDHLVGLGRYDDVRVTAAPAAEASGIVLRWLLTPVQLVTTVAVEGGGDLSASSVRGLVDERFGSGWPASRAPEVADEVRAHYRDRGYRAAVVAPVVTPGPGGAGAELTLRITPGRRTRVTSATVVGTPTEPQFRILERLRIEPGQAYDRQDLQRRLQAYEADLREDGHYEASVRDSTTFDDAGAGAAIEVTVDAGPRVRVVYAGDPVPEGRIETLVPVQAERSVDEDLLEDASRNIEAYLRERGYRDARAPYTRSERGGELVLTFTVDRGPLHRVAVIDLAGNRALPRADIEPLLKLTRGDPFVDARVGAIAAAIEELYRVRGYERVRVTAAVEVLPEAADGNQPYRPVDTRFTVVEGPQTLTGHVVIDGGAGIPEADVRAVLGLADGRPFYRPLLAADRDQLENLFRNHGFLGASVTPTLTLDAEAGRADVTWTIREGEQSRVDRVLVTGQERTSADMIRREMGIASGDPLSADAIAEPQRRLSQLGLYRRVRILDLPRTGTPRRDLLVTVEEAPSTTITYGGGLEVGRRPRASSDGGGAVERVEVAPRGFFEASRRNLWGKNRTLTFFSRVSLRPRDPAVDSDDPTDTGGYGLNDYRITGAYREPRAFGTPGDAQVTAFVEQGIRASFTFNRRGVRADYARRFGTGLTVTGRYTTDYTRLSNQQINPDDRLLIDRLFPQVRLSTISGAVLRDSRDDVLDPQRGTVLGFDGSVAARSYGSEVGFAKGFIQSFAYRRLPGQGVVLATGLRVGFAVGFPREVPRLGSDGTPVVGPDGQPVVDVVEDLPASERFFAGGDTTVRGFALDRIGALNTIDQQGFPQGGNGLLVLNAELRAPYWKGVGLVGFVDAGNVFRRAGEMEVADLRVATGFGLRYRSPIGPLRVDLGFKVNPRVLANGSRERGSIVHISLGQAF